jgi:tape measure domain-containing protein
MAMSLDTAIKFTAKLEGQGLDQLKRGLQGMAQQANRSSKDLDQLYNANKKLSQAAGQSINSLNRQVQVLTNLRNEAALGSRQFKFYSAELEKLQRQQARLTGTTQGGGGLLAMGGGLGGLAVAAGGGLTVKFIADAGLQAESAQVRLQALADEFGEYNQAQEAAARIARTLRISNTEATQSFASLYASLRPTGITIQELEKAFIGFSAAARNSGATAQETSNALIQLKQGLASGVLQGEELRSIREQAPLAAQAIARELGVSIGELKNLAAEGKVTTDVVLSALGKLQETQIGKLNQQFRTGAQALADLQNELRRTAEGIAKAFGPTAIALLRGFTQALQRVSDGLGLTEGAAERRADRVRADLMAQREASQKFGFGGFFRYGFEIDRFQSQRSEELFNQFQAERRRQAQAGLRDNPTGDQREAREAAAAEREAARQRARKEALEDELKIRKDAEDKLADAAQRNAEQLADFQRETAKRAAALERDLGDERLKIERQIADTRTKLQAVLEDRALEAERQRLAAAGLSTEGIDTAREVKEIFRRYDQQRIENDRNAVDAQTDLQRRLEEYKLSVAEGIGKIQEGYARSVSNILQDAGEKLAEKMRQGAQDAATTLGGVGGGAPGALGPNRLMPGSVGRGQLNVGQLKALAMAAGFNDRDASIMAAIAMAESGGRSAAHNNNVRTGDNSYGLWQVNMLGRMGPERRRQFGIGSNEALFDPAVNASAARKVFESQGFGAWSVFKSGAYRQFLPAAMRAQAGAPPAPMLPGAPAAGLPAGVQQAGAKLDAALSESKRQQQLLNEQQTLAALEQKYGAITEALSSQQEVAANKLRDELRYAELLKQGIAPELARQRVELEATAAIEQTKLLAMEQELQAKIATLPVESALRQELEKQVQVIEQRLNLQGQVVDKTMALTEAERKANDERERQERTIDAIANSIGSGLGQVFDLLASGTDDWAESLKGIASGVLKDIAKQLFQIYVIEAAIKALKGFLSGGTDAAGNFVPKISGFADGGIMTSSGPAPLKRYSQGGIANRPQLALYGEGSKPEAYVPLPDGRRIPVALQGQDKMREVMGAGPAQGATSPVLNMSFQTTNIGGVEYVSREQLEAAMAETRRAASRDGAKRGMTMTLDKLQQSPSTRTRVGLR